MNLSQMVRFTTEVTTSATLLVVQFIVLAVFELGMVVFRTASGK
ncbi:hypothetical protein [Alicyclobacillus mengziensis]|nr:hypothetical protein [Alicyclobacillus mengziensis]